MIVASRRLLRLAGVGILALLAGTLAVPQTASAASCGSATGPAGVSPAFSTWAGLQSALPGTCGSGDEFTVNITGNLTALAADSAINWYRAGTLIISGPVGAVGAARPVLDASAMTTDDAAIRSYGAFASGGSLILRNLIITGGRRSGVLAFWGTGANVTLDNTKVVGSSAPAANTEAGGVTNNSPGGDVTLQNGSEVSGNTTAASSYPGGVYSTDAVTIADSTVSGNTATGSSAAGGVRGDGTVTITSSTVASNTGTGDGGGVSSGSSVSLARSTISGNSSSGGAGGVMGTGSVTLTNATVTGNAGGTGSVGGIRSTVALTATFSTISGNTRPSSGYADVMLGANNPLSLTGSIVGGSAAIACSATAASRTALYSLSTSAGCLPASLGTNLLTTTGALALATLADNGGPTHTQLPANASVAVGFAPDALGTGLTTDQRGVSRAGLFTAGAVQVPLPLAPTGLAATPGLQSATLEFTAGADAGSPITNYEYALSMDGGTTYGAWTPMSPAAPTSPFTITGLAGSTSYHVKLRAVNVTGPGQPSAGVQVTPIATNADASLVSLTAVAGGAALPFAPAFAPGITAYTASVPTDVESMTVTPTVSDAYATVTVNGVTTASGSVSAALPLAVGVNTITVKVTASDGTTISSYVISVTRAAPAGPPQEVSTRSGGSPAVDPPLTTLQVGRLSVGSQALVARVTTSGAGAMVARGTAAGISGAACTGRRVVRAAGVFAVECVLTPRAQRAVVRQPLRVRVTVRFRGASGATASAARMVVVARRVVRPAVTG